MEKRNNVNSLLITGLFDFCRIVSSLIKDPIVKKEIVTQIYYLESEITIAASLENVTDEKEGDWMYRLSKCRDKIVSQVIGVTYQEFAAKSHFYLGSISKYDLNHYLNFNKPDLNPLAPEQIPDSNKAKELASEIIGLFFSNDNVFTANAINLLTACIWYLREDQPEKCNLKSAFSMIMNDSIEDLLQTLQNNKECAQLTESLYDGIKLGAIGQVSVTIQPLKNQITQIENELVS